MTARPVRSATVDCRAYLLRHKRDVWVRDDDDAAHNFIEIGYNSAHLAQNRTFSGGKSLAKLSPSTGTGRPSTVPKFMFFHQKSKKIRLGRPSAFVRNNSFHCGKYENGKLTFLLSLSVMNLNKTPGSIAISIDLAASTDTRHSMSLALTSIKKMMRKRRNMCVLFTQCAQTEPACAFWVGKLTNKDQARFGDDRAFQQI